MDGEECFDFNEFKKISVMNFLDQLPLDVLLKIVKTDFINPFNIENRQKHADRKEELKCLEKLDTARFYMELKI